MNAKEFGTRVRAARKALGLSQNGLAKKIGVTHAAISQWETGVTQEVKAELLLGAARVLGTSPDWLLYGIERASVEEAAGTYTLSRPLQEIQAAWGELTERQRERIADEVRRVAEENREVRDKPKG